MRRSGGEEDEEDEEEGEKGKSRRNQQPTKNKNNLVFFTDHKIPLKQVFPFLIFDLNHFDY